MNESSIEENMTKSYHSMYLRLHPDQNIHEDTSKVMSMINKVKEGLEDTLRINDAKGKILN